MRNYAAVCQQSADAPTMAFQEDAQIEGLADEPYNDRTQVRRMSITRCCRRSYVLTDRWWFLWGVTAIRYLYRPCPTSSSSTYATLRPREGAAAWPKFGQRQLQCDSPAFLFRRMGFFGRHFAPWVYQYPRFRPRRRSQRIRACIHAMVHD